MAQVPQNPKDVTIPGIIGGFNIPKGVIENKVDVLTFLEILVRKEIITASELDQIRNDVVAHLNAAYPDLALSYVQPQELKGPQQQKPATSIAAQSMAPPQSMAAKSMGSAATPTKMPPSAVVENPADAVKKANEMSKAANSPAPQGGNSPLYYEAPRPKFIK